MVLGFKMNTLSLSDFANLTPANILKNPISCLSLLGVSALYAFCLVLAMHMDRNDRGLEYYFFKHKRAPGAVRLRKAYRRTAKNPDYNVRASVCRSSARLGSTCARVCSGAARGCGPMCWRACVRVWVFVYVCALRHLFFRFFLNPHHASALEHAHRSLQISTPAAHCRQVDFSYDNSPWLVLARHIQKMHKWANVFYRQRGDPVTSVSRLDILFSMVLLSLVVSAMFFGIGGSGGSSEGSEPEAGGAEGETAQPSEEEKNLSFMIGLVTSLVIIPGGLVLQAYVRSCLLFLFCVCADNTCPIHGSLFAVRVAALDCNACCTMPVGTTRRT